MRGGIGVAGLRKGRSSRVAGLSVGWVRSLALTLLTLAATATAGHAQTVIYLVRHAEPSMTETQDPHLNLAGRERAHALVHVLAQAGITKIMSSDYNRTKGTVGPLAEALGLPVEIYDPRALPSFAEQLKRMTGRIVVAGHSNTTPDLVRLLGGDPGTPINENYEFDRLYQVVIGKDGTVTSTRLRYGPISGS